MTVIDRTIAERGLVLDEVEVELVLRLLRAFALPGMLAAPDGPVLETLIGRLS
jgi:hypothetical protein